MTRLGKVPSQQHGTSRAEHRAGITYQGGNCSIGARSFLIERGGRMLQSANLIEQWRVTQQEYLADASTVTMHQAIDERRLQVQQEMTALLGAFLNRSITLKEFNAMFQQKTQGAWNVFRMRGTSGGMYLNKLVKYLDNTTLTSHLRSGFRLPEDTREGQRHMQELTHYFERLIAQQKGLRSQLQPARIPFLLSAWWHLQDAHYWPIFFPLLHLMLMNEDSQAAQSDGSIEAYFAFRTRFVSLSRALGVS